MNVENLEKLASYLEGLPTDYEHFDMFDFFWVKNGGGYMYPDEAPLPPECGAVACAVGHGPAAGLPALEGESWSHYSDRVFDLGETSWNWCFSDRWKKVDNTPQGAAKRIRYMLEHGRPENSEAQRLGTAPYMFA